MLGRQELQGLLQGLLQGCCRADRDAVSPTKKRAICYNVLTAVNDTQTRLDLDQADIAARRLALAYNLERPTHQPLNQSGPVSALQTDLSRCRSGQSSLTVRLLSVVGLSSVHFIFSEDRLLPLLGTK